MSARHRIAIPFLLLGTAACTAGQDDQPVAASAPATPAPVKSAAAASLAPLPASIALGGALSQGGFARGKLPAGFTAMTLDGDDVPLDPDGSFLIAFDRDAAPTARLIASFVGNREIAQQIAVAPRHWEIERVNIPRLPGGASEAFMAIRRPELDRIVAARKIASDAQGWRQAFAWPVEGRISGRFGSQRIYRGGEAGSYHSGLDIAPGEGAVYSAPASGTVVLAANRPFSLEGNLLIVDHGNGLNSAFLHSRRIYVKEGERVQQGQALGEVGMTGRATGPHLHWSLVWQGRRLDPLLFLPARR